MGTTTREQMDDSAKKKEVRTYKPDEIQKVRNHQPHNCYTFWNHSEIEPVESRMVENLKRWNTGSHNWSTSST